MFNEDFIGHPLVHHLSFTVHIRFPRSHIFRTIGFFLVLILQVIHPFHHAEIYSVGKAKLRLPTYL